MSPLFILVRVCICQHGIYENIKWHAKMSQMLFFSNTRKAGLNWQFLPTRSQSIYKMLVICASDNKGRSLLNHECDVLHCYFKHSR